MKNPVIKILRRKNTPTNIKKSISKYVMKFIFIVKKLSNGFTNITEVQSTKYVAM